MDKQGGQDKNKSCLSCLSMFERIFGINRIATSLQSMRDYGIISIN